MEENLNLESLFNPKAIAIVGVSKESSTKSERYGRGAGFIGLLLKAGFPGRIYPINPQLDEVLGLKSYPSLTSVPDSIDLAIITISASKVPAILEECIKAGVKNVHVYSSGFSETEEKEGRELEKKLVEIVKKGKINLIGPNCIGLHLPKAKISTFSTLLDKSGPVAYISQSGGHTINFVGNAHAFGIGLSKVISYGNAAVLDSSDYLEYLGTDPETKIIALYLEGIKDGKRFYQVVKKINQKKPVIIWKGGLTESGAKAAASHTGSLAGKKEIWKSFFKQTGSVEVNSMEELLDVTATFLYLKRPQGRRVGLVIAGGGQSVAAADLLAQEGLELPTFNKEKREKLYNFIPQVNTSAKNPVDLGLGVLDLNLYKQVIKFMVDEPLLDLLVIDPQPEIVRSANPQQLNKLAELFRQFASYKPLAVILDIWEGDLLAQEQKQQIQSKLAQAGIVTYNNLPRACRAIAKFIDYHENLQAT